MTEDVQSWSTVASENDDADASINWTEGMAPSAVNNSARSMMAAVARWRDQIQWGGDIWAVVGGTVDAITLTHTPAPDALNPSHVVFFVATGANTGSVTLNVNNLGAKTLKRKGATLAAGDLAADQFVAAVYDGTDFQILDTMPFDAVLTGATQTLTNKTIAAGDNTLSGLALGSEVTGASTDLSDEADLARLTDLTTKLATPAGAVTVATDDKVVIQDTSDSDSIQTVTAQSIADLGGAPASQLIKAWAKVASDGTIEDSYNVTSVTRPSTGVYEITWDTDFADANYVVIGAAQSTNRSCIPDETTQAAGLIRVNVRIQHTNAFSNTGFYVIALGDQ